MYRSRGLETDGAPSPVLPALRRRKADDHLAPSRSRDLLLFLVFSETKTIRSCANIMASSKDVGLYAFTLALRHSGANANAQLILPGENFSKENSDKF